MTEPDDESAFEPPLEARLRDGFVTAIRAAPPAPPSVRARLSELEASPAASARRFRSWPRGIVGLAAGGAAILVGVAVIGLGTVRSDLSASPPAPASDIGSSASPASAPATLDEDASGGLFVDGQAASGDGWRLIAGRVGAAANPGSFDTHLTLYSGGGLIKPIEMLHIAPADSKAIDPSREALLVVDFLTGGDPNCTKVRFDGLVFDPADRRVTAHYTAAPVPPANPPVCNASGQAATMVIALPTARLAEGNLTIDLVRASSDGTETLEKSLSTKAPMVTVPASESSPADGAGTFAGGGIWATHRSTLELSVDGGATWRAATMPVARRPFVLDADHVWLASPGPGSTEFSGSPTDILHLVVDRTSDGGRTWTRSTVPGNVPGTSPVLAFADAAHGYLLAAGERNSLGEALYTTIDGGATWEVVPTRGSSSGQYLGSVIGLGPDGSLWAGTQGDAGPVGRPVLDVSRDGGRSWSDARLPGLIGSISVQNVVLGPPRFFGSSGVVAVAVYTEAGTETRIFTTTDSGRHWSATSPRAPNENNATAFAAAAERSWVAVGAAPDTLEVTDDAGATWHAVSAVGFHSEPVLWLGFPDPLHGAALVPLGDSPAGEGLVVTADGGATWTKAAFAP